MSAFAVRAGVSDGTGNTEVRELPLTTAVSRIRVESSAVCGTDVTLHDHGLKRPAVLGHHTIGRVDHLTPGDEKALGITVGTRVALEEYVGCGHCAECRSGRYRLCPAVDLWTGGERVGMIPVDRGSGLHGGNAEYMEISSRHVLHELPCSTCSRLHMRHFLLFHSTCSTCPRASYRFLFLFLHHVHHVHGRLLLCDW